MLVKNKLCQSNTTPSLEKTTNRVDSGTLWCKVLFGHWMLTNVLFNKQRLGLGLTLGLVCLVGFLKWERMKHEAP